MAAVRNFRIWGNVTTPTVAIVTINGVEVFNGTIEVADPPPVTTPPTVVPIIYGDYNGNDTESQTLTVEIEVVSGSTSFASMEVDTTAVPPKDWIGSFDTTSAGRSNILINGAPPSWPGDDGPTVPGGTPENPDWSGWAFSLNAGDVMTFDYAALPLQATTPA